MATPTEVGLLGLLAGGRGARRLTDRLGEGDEVVAGGWGRAELTVMPHEIPALGCGEPARM
jgi:hypothetical protein